MPVYDVAIVGGGKLGLWTAYRLGGRGFGGVAGVGGEQGDAGVRRGDGGGWHLRAVDGVPAGGARFGGGGGAGAGLEGGWGHEPVCGGGSPAGRLGDGGQARQARAGAVFGVGQGAWVGLWPLADWLLHRG